MEIEVKVRAQNYFFGVGGWLGGWLEKWRIKQSSIHEKRSRRPDAVWGNFSGLRKFVVLFRPFIDSLAAVISHICGTFIQLFSCLQSSNLKLKWKLKLELGNDSFERRRICFEGPKPWGSLEYQCHFSQNPGIGPCRAIPLGQLTKIQRESKCNRVKLQVAGIVPRRWSSDYS